MRKILILIIALASPLFTNGMLRAQDPCEIEPSSTYCVELKKTDGQNTLFGPRGIVTRITQFLTIVAGLVSVFMMILGGFRFITSEGVPQRVASARSTILYSAIGIVITLMAQVIISFILNKI